MPTSTPSALRARDDLVVVLTSGSLSAGTEDGGLLVSPTGSCLGRLDPARLSRIDTQGQLLSGDQPTKAMPLQSTFYATRSTAGAVVHLHSCHSVALSMAPGVDEDNFLPPLMPYAIMTSKQPVARLQSWKRLTSLQYVSMFGGRFERNTP